MEQFEISADGRALSVRIDASLSAQDVERLMHTLAEQRAEMAPEVPRSVEQAIDADAPIIEVSDPAAHFGITGSGAMRIALRHPGLGWIAFLLAPRDVAGVADLLGRKRPERGAAH